MTEKTTNMDEASSNSRPSRRTKHHSDDNPSTTSTNPDTHDDILNGSEQILNQQPMNSDDTATQQPSNNDIFNFILPSEDDCALAPDKNLEPNSAGLKRSRTGGVCQKSLEESHATQINERSLLGHILYSEETRKKILEPDIFRILESEGVTEIGAVNKVSPSKFVLVFGSKKAKEKLSGAEIQCRFGDSETCLNFCKRNGPLRDGRDLSLSLSFFLSSLVTRQ